MEFAIIFIVVTVLIIIVSVSRSKERDRESDNDANQVSHSGYNNSRIREPLSSGAIPTPTPTVNRKFTLAELRRADAGRYSWDDTGCVFEINTDGSVTVVGHFDPAELLIDPVEEMIIRLDEAGLFEMLPRMWCISDPHPGIRTTWLTYNDQVYCLETSPTISEIKNASLELTDGDDINSMVKKMIQAKSIYMFLLPTNEMEYILSLGAMACIERNFEGRVKPRIVFPAVMGAYWTALSASSSGVAKFSYAFGENDDYMCCNMESENGVYEVKQILNSSILFSQSTEKTIDYAARACAVQGFILYGEKIDALLVNVFHYTASLVQIRDEAIIKVYDFYDEQAVIPFRNTIKDVEITAGDQLKLYLGSSSIADVISESGLRIDGFTTLKVAIEFDVNMKIKIEIMKGNESESFSVGELIG